MPNSFNCRALLQPLLMVLAMMLASAVNAAETFVYNASCKGSHFKQGEQSADLTRQAGTPIDCDSAVVSFLDNGRVLFQITEKRGQLMPLGFSGSGFDFEMNPNFATVHLATFYPPHYSRGHDSSRTERLDGIEGFCFFEGKVNLRSLTGATCSAKVEIGTQKLVYSMEVRFIGTGKILAVR